jgi:hypothetical protein
VNLDPNVRTTVPPKIVLKSQGELSFYDIEVDNSGAVYLLFVEDGHKLLFYHVADNEFHFITEDKFTNAHLIITPGGEVYLTYIDESNVVRFRRMVEVVKSH